MGRSSDITIPTIRKLNGLGIRDDGSKCGQMISQG